jgi:hypothetical protein
MTTVYKKTEAADADARSGPHTYIQWKGTDVCMDVHCSCGKRSHVDAEFAYHIRCPHCRQLWAMCSHVRMVAIDDAELVNGASETMAVP